MASKSISPKELLGKIIKKRKQQRINIASKFKNKLEELLKEDVYVGSISKILFDCSTYHEKCDVQNIVSNLIPSAEFIVYSNREDVLIEISWSKMEND